jgi:hypothetical protein
MLSLSAVAQSMGSKEVQADKPSQINNYIQMATEVLDQLIEAYAGRNAVKFMSLVAEEFAGDRTILDRAIRKDFSLFTNIDNRYTFNNVTADSKGIFIYASLNFTMTHTVIKTGKPETLSGTTEMIFRVTDKSAKLQGMKHPLIFGVSDPAAASGK